jgi:chemotaxis protein CheD
MTLETSSKKKKHVKIHIGEIYTASEPTVIETILGSCVSVCLFDPVKKTGGMNHILLPGRGDLEKFDGATRYGKNAMEVLINSMIKIGSRRKDIISKIYGGAHILKAIALHMSPGFKNVRFVEEFLELEGIPIMSQNTGGSNGRKIFFHTHTGDVFLKTLPNTNYEAVAREEDQVSELVSCLIDTPVDMELFKRPEEAGEKVPVSADKSSKKVSPGTR